MDAYGPQSDGLPAGVRPAEHHRLSMADGALAQVSARLAAIEQSLQEFQQVVWALLALARHSPVYLDVERLEVERLEFRVDTIDVEELSGEMNIGLTTMFKTGQAGPHRVEPDTVAPDEAPAGVAAPIWPPTPWTEGEQPRPPAP